MGPAWMKNEHDTVVVVVVGENTSEFVLIRSRRTGLWRFPGDRIRIGDIQGSYPYDIAAAAERAAVRIIRERTGLVSRVRRVLTCQRSIGSFYGYVGLADFRQFAPLDGENTRIFPFKEVADLRMTGIQRTAFYEVIRWIQT